ncbi:hypothetical protein KIF59_08660 [Enterobacter cloacae subsp. cloacae]|nr:hypothetical protein [Enterobacter cloacae subsp. cloacae]
MTRIVCVGITVLDRIWYLNDLPKEVGNMSQKDYTEVGGGPAATAGGGGKLGHPWILLAGWVTTIPAEGCLRSWNPGVNTRYTRIVKDARSSQSAVLVDGSGERIIANYPSPDLLLLRQTGCRVSTSRNGTLF